jgi:hypothetical protein
VGLFCSPMGLQQAVSTLRLTITHVVDFGIWPECVREHDPRMVTALTLKDLLFPDQLEKPVMYNTQFCCTGMGMRSLSTNELSHAFGFKILVRAGGVTICELGHFLPA